VYHQYVFFSIIHYSLYFYKVHYNLEKSLEVYFDHLTMLELAIWCKGIQQGCEVT
jgi:hypothetical protein